MKRYYLKRFSYLFLFLVSCYFLVQNAGTRTDFLLLFWHFYDVPLVFLLFFSFCLGIVFWMIFRRFLLPREEKEADSR